MAQAPQSQQPSQPARPRQRRRRTPWYRKPEIMVSLLVAVVVGVLTITFNFPKVQHLIGLDNANSPPALSPTTSSISDPYGRKGSPLLDDPLVANTTDGRWQVGTDNNRNSCSFRVGGYEIKATHYAYVCKDEIDVFANFVLQVDMSLSRQSEGAVLFRVPETGGGYYFGIDDRGNYEMRKNNPEPPLRQITHRDTPQSHYELTIVANGSTLDIYIDGKKLDHFDDASYSDGYIALAVGEAAGPINQPNTEVIFTNLKVWQR